MLRSATTSTLASRGTGSVRTSGNVPPSRGPISSSGERDPQPAAAKSDARSMLPKVNRALT
jgi:hypothetical protein